MLSSLLLSTLALGGVPADGSSYALRATRVHVGDGTVLENAIVLVEDGRIVDVGKGVAVGKDVPVIELEGDLSAGLIALRDYSGLGAEGADSTRAVMDGADIAFAFNPASSEMERLVQAGVTSMVLAPRSGSNLIGGLAAVVKPGARVAKAQAFLHMDLSTSGLRSNRYPTSYAGAYELLEGRLAEPKGAFAELAAGRLRVLLEAETRAEVQRALAFAERHNLKGVLVGSRRAGELAAAVKVSGLGVALGPFAPGADSKYLASAAALAKAGVPLGFALDGPTNGPCTLRLSAAACVRAGLSRDDAFRALTSGAAELAGVGDRQGSIKAGMDADLVLWSGDPVDPASQVRAVWIDGKKVHEAPADDDDDDEEEDD
jgi:Amidohydrolase family